MTEPSASLLERIELLRRRLHNETNSILPLVGADVPSGLPTFHEMLVDLIELVEDAALAGEMRDALAQKRFQDVASALEADGSVGRSKLTARIAQLYRRPKREAPPIFNRIAMLPVTHFATTAYHPFLKNALARKVREAPRVYVPEDPGAFGDTRPSSPPLVLMLHGDADRPATCVASETGYRQLVHGQAYRAAMSALLDQRTLLLIGTGDLDPDLHLLLEGWQSVFSPGGDLRHFLLGTKVGKMSAQRLERCGVEVLDLISMGDNPLEQVLIRLATVPQVAATGYGKAQSLRGRELSRYLDCVDSQHGSVVLTGLLRDRAVQAVPVERVYVSLDVARPERTTAEPTNDNGTRASKRRRHAKRTGTRGGAISPDNGENPIARLAYRLDRHLFASATYVPDDLRPLIMSALRAIGASEDEVNRPDVLLAMWSRIHAGSTNIDALAQLLRRQSIEDAVRAARHLLIEGAPGAGKTTVLKHVTMALVEAHRGHPARALAMGFSAPFPVPIFVFLRRFASWVGRQPEERRRTAGAELLVEYLREIVGSMTGGGGWLGSALEHGGVALLLDGLDEIADAHLRDRTADIVRDAAREHAACRFLLTSRPAGLSGIARRMLTELGNLSHTTVQPLDDAQVDRFVHAWYRALLTSEDEANRQASDLLGRIRQVTNRSGDLATLARTPILLTAIAVVHQSYGRLPERRADLYEHCVQSLAHLWQQAKDVEDGMDRPDELTQDQKLGLLQQIALRIQETVEHAQTIEIGPLTKLVAERLSDGSSRRREPAECRSIISTMAERSGLLVPDRDGSYRFRHLQFQEFLAARCICVERGDRIDLLAKYIANASWREVVVLAPAFKALSDKVQTREILNGLLQHVKMLPDAHDQMAALATTARALFDLREYDVSGLDSIAKIIAAIAEPLLEAEAQPGTMLDRVGVAGALALCSEGDPRLRPDRQWVKVPAGEFWRGNEKVSTDEALLDNTPSGWVYLSDFYVQRWPVTVGEYARFLRDGGYAEKQWWSRKGWSWRERRGILAPTEWSRQRVNFANVPIGGVSWWEAEAYCRWLNSHLLHSEDGLVVRLPTEAEWEKATRGGQYLIDREKNPYPKRGWPWGLKGTRLNLPREILPVGLFPTNHGPYGSWDQVGCMFEWCLDWYDPRAYSYLLGPDPCLLDEARAPKLGSETMDYKGKRRCRAQRGYNAVVVPDAPRLSRRDWYPPEMQARYVGFRCVLAAPRTT
ncbi:SUMF1/EgtB/PvdO family nonheme iron enzyme [Sorangium sp. So ce145]|uniref:SUMF1/EgtB/PvdO family nonheme iron enzyme n=1 Tax=Sorangium sp. So ce145 TaxID=3133285 RepID=UPI003F61E3E0